MQSILIPKQVQILSARQYMQAMRDKSQKDNIKNIRFVPPKIGADDFGRFEVTYKIPVLVAE